MKYFRWLADWLNGNSKNFRFWIVLLFLLFISVALGGTVVAMIIIATHYPWGFAVIVWLYIVAFIAWQSSK